MERIQVPPAVGRAVWELVEQLKNLTLLTYADVSAVNPTAMSPWRLEQLWRIHTEDQIQAHLELERLSRELGAAVAIRKLNGVYSAEIVARDRPGLLYDLAGQISAAGCNIEVVLIDTEAHKALDVFYVTFQGKKLPPQLQERLQENLLKACGV